MKSIKLRNTTWWKLKKKMAEYPYVMCKNDSDAIEEMLKDLN